MPSHGLGAPLVTPAYHPPQEMVVDATQDDNDNPLYATDEFRMAYYKILPCAKRFVHDWTSCPFAHPGEKARRRDPLVTQYTGIACPDMKKTGSCARGDRCPYAHQVFEYWLNYTRYRTQLCNDGPKCRRRVCFFAHTMDELRVAPVKPYVAPQYLASLAAEAPRKGGGSHTPDTPFGPLGPSPASSSEPASKEHSSNLRSRSLQSEPRHRPQEPEPDPGPLFAKAPTELQILVDFLHAALGGPQRQDTIEVVSRIIKKAVQDNQEAAPSPEESPLGASSNVFGHLADASFDAPWPGPDGTSSSAWSAPPAPSIQVSSAQAAGGQQQGSAGGCSGSGQQLNKPEPSLEAGLAGFLLQRGDPKLEFPDLHDGLEEAPLLPPDELANAVAALARTNWQSADRDTRHARHLTGPLTQAERQAAGLGLLDRGSAPLPPSRPTRRSLSLEGQRGHPSPYWQGSSEISQALLQEGLASMGIVGDLRHLSSVLHRGSLQPDSSHRPQADMQATFAPVPAAQQSLHSHADVSPGSPFFRGVPARPGPPKSPFLTGSPPRQPMGGPPANSS